MSYEYAVEKINYEDFASGRVLYNQKGTTSFPARLISEIFLRCVYRLEKQGVQAPYTIYDPLCGGAYGLTILGFLHNSYISNLIASDAEEAVIGLAGRNLSLLSEEGMRERICQIKRNLEEFGKDSHREAYESARKLRETVQKMPHRIQTLCFQADALKPDQTPTDVKTDLVITDLPYGELVDWDTEEGADAVALLLENLLPKLKKHSVVAIISDKNTRINNENYKRVDKFKVGKRKIVILQPVQTGI